MQKKTARLSWFSVVLVVALISILAYLIASQIVTNHPGALRSSTALSARTGQKVEPMDDGLLYNDGTTLHALGSNGLQIWSYAAGSGSDFSVGKGGVAAWKNTTLSLLSSDQGATLYSGNMDDTILDARMDEEYAAVQEGEEHNSTIVILEHGGRQSGQDRFQQPYGCWISAFSITAACFGP